MAGQVGQVVARKHVGQGVGMALFVLVGGLVLGVVLQLILGALENIDLEACPPQQQPGEKPAHRAADDKRATVKHCYASFDAQDSQAFPARPKFVI